MVYSVSKQLLKTDYFDLGLKISLGLILFTILSYAIVYAETITVDVEGTSFDVEYTAIGLTLNSIETDLDFVSLILLVDVVDIPATLDITFDRAFFDAPDADGFIVIGNAETLSFTETINPDQSKTLSIIVPIIDKIEIFGESIGSSVLPDDDKQAVDEEATDEKTVDELAVDEQAAQEQADAEQAAQEQADAEQAAQEQAEAQEAADKAAAEEAAAEQAAQDAIDNANAQKIVDSDVCGEGTILQDGICVADTKKSLAFNDVFGLITYAMGAFIAAGSIGVLAAIIARASKKKQKS